MYMNFNNKCLTISKNNCGCTGNPSSNFYLERIIYVKKKPLIDEFASSFLVQLIRFVLLIDMKNYDTVQKGNEKTESKGTTLHERDISL